MKRGGLVSLKLIKSFKEQKIIEKPEEYNFPVEKTGIYFIEITARAKSWWQKYFRNFFSDDEIKVEIDGVNFYNELDNRRRNASKFNGNGIKNLQKTIVYMVYLEKKDTDCTIRLMPQYKPILEQINIYQATNNKVIYEPTINNPAEDGDGREWYSIIFPGQYLSAFSIIASCKEGKQHQTNNRDDDDLQLIIDGERIKNSTPKSHKYWYWCGNILKGQTKTYTHESGLESDYHTIELNADRSPKLDRIYLNINIPEVPQPSIYKPTKENPKWTGDFNDDTEEIIMARLIFGEAENQPDKAKIWIASSVLNRIKSDGWVADTIHEVILQKGQYDPFKKTDPNYDKIIDPLTNADSSRKEAWYKCYDIAEDVISGKIKNPTRATHFHGKGVTRDWFEKHVVPNGEFLEKIGDTYFYWSPN